ncbi:hypothetical protein [Methylacidimicrobium sp. B4]|uniref:hypothetical protein n=1 Tax=Methylacidimicrobium sp. B4 TaxID=2796139 RepID=UPI001A8FE539|nr:hypothetical protein [Methylacidimicrobium sp. B4]QSR83999.1 hypothetical protein MacB4_06950 [Methylacidimicrobium sp. B4]
MPERSGFVALFEEPLDREGVEEMVAHWIARFERVEQALPVGERGGTATMEIHRASDIFWEEYPQFRITEGDAFTWVYLSLRRKSVETTGFSTSGIPFCLEVLLELPRIHEIIDEKNEARLTELEQEGIL